MFKTNLYRPRGCFICNSPFHIAKWCRFKKETTRRPVKSANRRAKDNARLTAFKDHKSMISELPFANVNDDELQSLLPKLTNVCVLNRSNSKVKLNSEIGKLKYEKQNIQDELEYVQQCLNDKISDDNSIQTKLDIAVIHYEELRKHFHDLEDSCQKLVLENDIIKQKLSEKDMKCTISNDNKNDPMMYKSYQNRSSNKSQQVTHEPVSNSKDSDIEEKLPRLADTWYKLHAYSKPGLATHDRILDQPKTNRLRCHARKLRILRYQVDVKPSIWREIRYKPGMTLEYVHRAAHQRRDIHYEEMKPPATFFLFDNELYATVHNRIDLREFPLDNDNTENGKFMYMYINTRGDLFQNGDFICKSRNFNKGRKYGRCSMRR